MQGKSKVVRVLGYWKNPYWQQHSCLWKHTTLLGNNQTNATARIWV